MNLQEFASQWWGRVSLTEALWDISKMEALAVGIWLAMKRIFRNPGAPGRN